MTPDEATRREITRLEARRELQDADPDNPVTIAVLTGVARAILGMRCAPIGRTPADARAVVYATAFERAYIACRSAPSKRRAQIAYELTREIATAVWDFEPPYDHL